MTFFTRNVRVVAGDEGAGGEDGRGVILAHRHSVIDFHINNTETSLFLLMG